LLKKAEKSSSEATDSSRGPCGGDNWFKLAMYWDTLGPRWPLYADMGDSVVSLSMKGDEFVHSSDVVGCMEALGGEFRGYGDGRVE
jgi:hypothetical protein